MKQYDAIIIGSGIGGLAAALCLAREGKKIIIIEQHVVPGGWCHSFYINGQRFSPGVHYIDNIEEGQSTNKLLKGLGIANDLVFFRMNSNAFEHCWIGEHKIDLPSKVENWISVLSEKFPDEKKRIIKYLKLVKNVSDQIQLIPKMKGFWDNITIPYRTRHLGKFGLFPLKKVIKWHIKNPLLRQILNIQCGNHGLAAANASFPLHCAVMDHYFEGGYYPMGGGAGLVKAFTNKIKQLNGEIKLGSNVEKIIVEKNENKIKAIGIKLSNGEEIYANAIISNTDPHNTYKMIGTENLSEKLSKKIAKTKYSVSSLMFFVVVNMDLSNTKIDSGNIWMTNEGEKDSLEQDVFNENKFSSLFISCSSLKDPTSYDGIHHTFEIVTFVNYDSFSDFHNEEKNRSESYLKMKQTLCNKLLDTMDLIIPDFKENTVNIELGTPITNQYYIQGTRGNVYGTEKGFWQTGPFSFSHKSEIENLFLCGASIISHGVAGSAYSGVKAASIVLNKNENEILSYDENQKLRVYDAEDEKKWPENILNKIKIKREKTIKLMKQG